MRSAPLKTLLPAHRIFVGAALTGGMLFCLLLTSCASVPHPTRGTPKREIQWPPPPLAPRVVWLSEIHDYQDAAIGKGFWKRLTEFFAGETDSRIVKPYGVHCDDSERLLVVDAGAALVHVLDLKSRLYTIIGDGNERIFRSPIGITEDDAGHIYVTDSVAGSVFRYSLKQGRLEPFIVSDLGRPTGIAFNRNNRLLYITDTINHQIVVFDLRGNIRFRIGDHGDGPGQLNYPTDLFVDGRGRLYVTDALNSRVSIFTADGTHKKTFGSPGDGAGTFAKPKGIAVDSAGNIYVCDALLDAVQVFNEEGELLLVFGSNGTDAGQFWMPAGIYIDGNDTIYVADTYNRRIQIFQYVKGRDTVPSKDPDLPRAK